MGMTTIVLASASPRRRELLALLPWPLRVKPVGVDEKTQQREDPLRYAERMALEKAYAAEIGEAQGRIIVGADTVVVQDGHIMGKPVDGRAAREMLLALRGKCHTVITALALLRHGQEMLVHCETEVPMRDFSEEEVAAYIASGSPLDKAGAYGIQDAQFEPVLLQEMHGCFANVMGLPLCHLMRSLEQLGERTGVDVALACQNHTGYDCAVFGDILRGEA
jgi:septum formation protein